MENTREQFRELVAYLLDSERTTDAETIDSYTDSFMSGIPKLKKDEIPQLYYRYKKTSDDDIRKYLNDVKVVHVTNKGVDSIHGYYPLNEESINMIKEKPRGKSLTFDTTETEDTPIEGLEVYKDVTYLCKSTSRFFLKPDIGEIFDQIDFRDLFGLEFKAIVFRNDYHTLDGTDGEHHIMVATLLK